MWRFSRDLAKVLKTPPLYFEHLAHVQFGVLARVLKGTGVQNSPAGFWTSVLDFRLGRCQDWSAAILLLDLHLRPIAGGRRVDYQRTSADLTERGRL
jgi:hypothetical protein